MDNEYKEVVLAARVVQGLIGFNGPALKENQNIDLVFIKALIIATCTIEAIKNGMDIKNGIRKFIYGLFFD